jgi:protein-export SecD/SecF family membrane protein
MFGRRLLSLVLIALAAALGYYLYTHPTFKLGLDLRGGSHLVYEADVSELAAGDVKEAMSSLREVIERRINAFGVAEPLIQVEESSLTGSTKHRLIIELPGVTNLQEAIKLINVTPELDFRLVDQTRTASATSTTFVRSGLTGRFLKRATVEFHQQSVNPSIGVEFNDEGTQLFSKITAAHVSEPIGIFLDGKMISAPMVREVITSGKAEISGNFTVESARELARNLNLGALPVPISLLSTETVGPTLGAEALDRGVHAGLLGLLVVAIFMILWYRLPGVVAVVSLAIYVVLMLGLFKLFGITLTAAGIAGFILSVGMAVDANILIFARLKEEMKHTDNMHDAIGHAFSRAWLSIRDSNLSSIITALILFWFGTSLIKGFALTLALGVLVSMLTAITITRTFLLSLGVRHRNRLTQFLFSSGVTH